MLFAGFNVSDGDQTLIGICRRRRRSATWSAPGSPTRSATTAASTCWRRNKLIHISPARLAWVDGWFQRHGDVTVFVCPPAAAGPRLHLAAGRAGEDALLALHLADRARLASPGWSASALIGRAVGDNWEQWRDHLHDPRLPRGRGDRRADRLRARSSGGAAAARSRRRRLRRRDGQPAALERSGEGGSRPGARSRWASSRARPSCCRSPAPPTSSSSPGWPAGTGTRSTRRCARASRSPSTPAPRRRC